MEPVQIIHADDDDGDDWSDTLSIIVAGHQDDEEDDFNSQNSLHDSPSSALEQVEESWADFIGTGGAVFQLSTCDLDAAALQLLVDKVQAVPVAQRPKDVELDLCRFVVDSPENNQSSNQEDVLSLWGQFCHLLQDRLTTLEVENRLLPEPWPAEIAGPFLTHVAQLHRLERLALWGVDLQTGCGPGLKQVVASPDCRISWLSISFCCMDVCVMKQFCQGLATAAKGGACLKKLYMYEIGMTDEMLRLLVQKGLSHNNERVCPALRELHLARNQLSFQSLEYLSDLLHKQPQLQVLSVSHNVKLFSDPPPSHLKTNETRDSECMEASTSQKTPHHSQHLQQAQHYEHGSSTLTWLPAQNHPELQGFLAALYNHIGLLHFWAQSSSPAATQYPTTSLMNQDLRIAMAANGDQRDDNNIIGISDWAQVVEEFCAPLLERNRLLQYVQVRPKLDNRRRKQNNDADESQTNKNGADVPPVCFLTIDTTAELCKDHGRIEVDVESVSLIDAENELAEESSTATQQQVGDEDGNSSSTFNDRLSLSVWPHALQRLGRGSVDALGKSRHSLNPRVQEDPADMKPRQNPTISSHGCGGATPVYAFLHCRLEALWMQSQKEPIVSQQKKVDPLLTSPNGDPKLKSE